VCQDFKNGACVRPACKFVHIVPDYVEETADGHVSLCRDAVRGRCSRTRCRYYHLPVQLAPGLAPATGVPLGLL